MILFYYTVLPWTSGVWSQKWLDADWLENYASDITSFSFRTDLCIFRKLQSFVCQPC